MLNKRQCNHPRNGEVLAFCKLDKFSGDNYECGAGAHTRDSCTSTLTKIVQGWLKLRDLAQHFD